MRTERCAAAIIWRSMRWRHHAQKDTARSLTADTPARRALLIFTVYRRLLLLTENRFNYRFPLASPTTADFDA